MTTLVSIDGRIVGPGEAMVSVFDRGFLYGDSVFETLRTYQGKPYALDEHLARLRASAELVFIDVPVPLTQLATELFELLRRVDSRESYVRIMLTRGEGELGLDPTKLTGGRRVIIVSPLSSPPPERYERGVEVIAFRADRPGDAVGASAAKLGNYLVAVLATRAASLAGAAEALIVDGQGRVLEGASSNVFWVEAGRLLTPPEGAGILSGITRAGVLTCGAALGLVVGFECPTLERLKHADEVFLTSSIREIMPVVVVDKHRLSQPEPGPVTRIIHKQFQQFVRSS